MPGPKHYDKVIEYTPAVGVRTFVAQLVASEDMAYIFDPNYEEPVFKFGPINDKSHMEMVLELRKAARYMLGIERDSAKLEASGFQFIKAPKLPEATRRRPYIQSKKEEKKEKERSAGKPKWM